MIKSDLLLLPAYGPSWLRETLVRRVKSQHISIYFLGGSWDNCGKWVNQDGFTIFASLWTILVGGTFVKKKSIFGPKKCPQAFGEYLKEALEEVSPQIIRVPPFRSVECLAFFSFFPRKFSETSFELSGRCVCNIFLQLKRMEILMSMPIWRIFLHK